MDNQELLLAVAGGIGLLFFGIRMLSESLQSLSGSLNRRLIGRVGKNRIQLLLIGTLITSIVQSSSITTVTVVGFVNAGLMNLSQAVGVILGANIGTTITGWIMVLGLDHFAPLFLGLSVIPLLLSHRERLYSWSRVLFSLGLLFLGLDLMKQAFLPFGEVSAFSEFLLWFEPQDAWGLARAIGLALIVTLVIQSSTVVLGITLALATAGLISFELGVAFVLGENLGTTMTALLASRHSNTAGRRAAFAHVVFNFIGVLFVGLFFFTFVNLVEGVFAASANLQDADGWRPWVGVHLAMSHTLFNALTALALLPFLKTLTLGIQKFLPEQKGEIEDLKYIGDASSGSPELGIQLAQLELKKMATLTQRAVELTGRYIQEEEENIATREKILKYESITDNIHQEMMKFTGKLMRSSLTENETDDIKRLLRVSDELESIADYCQKIVFQMRRLHEQEIILPEQGREKLAALMGTSLMYVDLIFGIFDDKVDVLEEEHSQWSESFDRGAEEVREYFLELVQKGEQPPFSSLAVSDLVLGMRRIYSHTKNIYEAKKGIKLAKRQEPVNA